MTDVAILTARLDALRAARASGVREVELRTENTSQRTAFRTDAEISAAIAALESEIAAASGTRPVRNIIVRNAGGW